MQGDERTACAPFSVVSTSFAACCGIGHAAVNQFCLCLRELVACSISKFVHAFCSDYLMERPHFALEEGLAVTVGRRIPSKDVPSVRKELSPDCADDLVARLAAVDHRPAPPADL